MVACRRRRDVCVRTASASARSIRSDAAHFVDYYERMRKTGIADAYRARVRLHGLGDRAHPRGARSVMHRRRPRAHRAVSGAIRLRRRCRWASANSLPAGTALAQVATSACRPAIDNFDLHRCRDGGAIRRTASRSTASRRLAARARDPRAEAADHASTDWRALTAQRARLWAPRTSWSSDRSPLWRPGLPAIFARASHEGSAPTTSAAARSQTSSRSIGGVGGACRPARRDISVSCSINLCRAETACLAARAG